MERTAPPTTTDYVGDEKPGSSIEDIERNSQKLGTGIDNDEQQSHHVHPDIEKRVVREMDHRVVPLVSALCLFLYTVLQWESLSKS